MEEELKENYEPDDSVPTSQFEGTPPDEAAGNVKRLSKIAEQRKLSPQEKAQYDANTIIADSAGILPDEINEEDCTIKR